MHDVSGARALHAKFRWLFLQAWMIFRAFRFYNEIIFIFILSKKRNIFSRLRKVSSLGGRDEITKRAIIESQSLYAWNYRIDVRNFDDLIFSNTAWRFTQGDREKRLCVSRTDNKRERKVDFVDADPRWYSEGWPRANGGLISPAPLPLRVLWQVSHTTTAIGFFRLLSLFVSVIRLLLRAQPAFADSFIGFSLSLLSFLSPPPPPIPRPRIIPSFIVSVPLLPRGYTFLLSRKIQSVRARRIRAASTTVMQQISVNERERSKRKISVISLWNIMRRNKEASYPSLLR